MKIHLPFLTCLPILLFASCSPYRQTTHTWVQEHALQTERLKNCEEAQRQRIEKASKHWLYHLIPRHKDQLYWFDLGHWISWSLFGNDDDGIFGEMPTANFKVQSPISSKLALRWGMRNPLHNFSFYIIGSADKANNEVIIAQIQKDRREFFTYYPKARHVLCSNGSSFLLALHGYKPFIAVRLGRVESYFGWRERGNFGIKLRRRKQACDKT